MRTDRLLAVLIGLALWAVALEAVADDYYVDPVSGSDAAGNGSQANPWKTITYANSQTKSQGTAEDPVVLHALPGVYSASANGETFPVRFDQYDTYGPGGSPVPHFGALVGAGCKVTILDAEYSDYVLRSSGHQTTASGLMVTGGSKGGLRALMGSNGSFTLESCHIKDNTGGDGLKVFDAGTLVIANCVFTGNRCASSVTRAARSRSMRRTLWTL